MMIALKMIVNFSLVEVLFDLLASRRYVVLLSINSYLFIYLKHNPNNVVGIHGVEFFY